MIATFLLGLATAKNLRDTIKNQNDASLVFGHSEDNKADYDSLLFDQVLVTQEEKDLHVQGRDFILNDNTSKAPYYTQEKCQLQNGPGVWTSHGEKSGIAKTIIPAKVITTKTYEETCEEGVSKECYLNKQAES